MTDSGRTGHSGYSGTPLARKLRIKPGQCVALWHPPMGWVLPELPEDVRVDVFGDDGPTGPGFADADVVLAFHRSAGELRANARTLVDALRPASCLWVLWPRRAAGHLSDVTDTLVREVMLALGVVDVKVAAVGEDWSGLAFVWRKGNRSG